MKVKAIRNDESGLIELGVEDDGHFVALVTQPASQYDSTIANLKAQAAGEETPAS